MEKYVIPPIFNLDFKFPAYLLLLQQLRQVQKSQRLSNGHGNQPGDARLKVKMNGSWHGGPAGRD